MTPGKAGRCDTKWSRFWVGFVALVALAPISVGMCAPRESPPFSLPVVSELRRIRSAVIVTSRGRLYVELYPDKAPWHVANFKYRADKGLYRGVRFHHLQEGYLVQGGDPTGTGRGNPYTIPGEFNDIPHELGTLGMARASRENPERRSNGAQFYIALGALRHLEGLYTTFGRIVEGRDIVPLLREGDVIEDVVVYVR